MDEYLEQENGLDVIFLFGAGLSMVVGATSWTTEPQITTGTKAETTMTTSRDFLNSSSHPTTSSSIRNFMSLNRLIGATEKSRFTRSNSTDDFVFGHDELRLAGGFGGCIY